MAARNRRADSTDRPPRRGGAIAGGVGTGVLLFVVLLVPVIATLLVPETPITLSVPAAILVFAVVGAVVGLVLQTARIRPLYAGSAAVVLAIIALWLQRGTWLPAPFLPAPPLLPHVPPTVTLVTGAFIATTLVAMATASRGRHGAAATSSVVSAGVGILAAAAVVVVTEADVWGLGVHQRTFQGPFGMSRFTWLAVIFLGGLVAGALVGWVATSSRYRPMAPTVGTVLLVAFLAVSFGRITGPPRTTVYGLSLGLLLVAAVASVGRPRSRPDEPADTT